MKCKCCLTQQIIQCNDCRLCFHCCHCVEMRKKAGIFKEGVEGESNEQEKG